MNKKTFIEVIGNNINCSYIKNIDIPDNIKKIIDKHDDIVIVQSKKKNYKNKVSMRDDILKIICELFEEANKNKTYINDICKYINEVKNKCNKEYIKYVKELIRINYTCDRSKNINEVEYFYFSKYDELLYNNIALFTNSIISKLKIDKNIINIENKRNIILIQTTNEDMNINIISYDKIFNFSEKINGTKFTDKYKINKDLIVLSEKIKKYNFLDNYMTMKDSDINELYKLKKEFNDSFSKIINNNINNKEYIKDYKDFCNEIKKNDKEYYSEYIKYINTMSKFLSYYKKIKTKLIIEFKKNFNKIYKISIK